MESKKIDAIGDIMLLVIFSIVLALMLLEYDVVGSLVNAHQGDMVYLVYVLSSLVGY